MSESPEQTGFVAPDPADLAPLFPGYDIQGLIAAGGMGAVYCAVQRSLDRTVALKILPMEFSNDAAFCAGFEAEAKAMARLNHPNLIGVYDFGSVNGMLYIIMEYVPGKSLYHSAYGLAIDPAEVIRLVAAICNGLAHAHENGIIHRDIKPSNILLDLNAQPKIGDFGLARPIDRKVEEGEEIFGTPHYTAPEVVNSPHSVDSRADIFSVGVLLHELLTGKLPADDPRPASTIAHCDPRFDTIIRRATQPIPAARYSSASQIATDLQAIAAAKVPKVPGTAVMARPRPVRAGGAYPVVRKKSSSSASMLLLLVVIAAAGAAYVYFSKPLPVKEPVPVGKQPAPPPIQPAPKVDPVELPETKPEEMTPPPVPPPVPEAEPQTAPAPVPAEPAQPQAKYDVPGFFERARKIMLERVKPLVASHQASLKSNLSSFERELNLRAHKMKTGAGPAEESVESVFATWQSGGGKIPESLDSQLSDIPGADGLFDEYLERQTGFDAKFRQGIAQQEDFYISGLEKQIERLKADNDTGAILLIEREIEVTRETPGYFSGLMLGDEAAADSTDGQ